MGTVLVTGASGFVGHALAASLAESHDVICMSRHDPRLGLPWIRGNFASFEDLRQLDSHSIDVVVHLAAVTGGCLEREGILVNVEGTRCLMRYLMDRGCRRYVLASSIAAVGFQSTRFRPLQAPIADEHPCLDRDGYGVSKYLMEEIARYHQRQVDSLDITVLRLASVRDDDALPQPAKPGAVSEWALGSITILALSDAVRAFTLAAEAPYRAGVRIMNAVGPRAWVADPVADVLRSWWGADVDLSHYECPGHEYDSIFDPRRIKTEIGFEAKVLPG